MFCPSLQKKYIAENILLMTKLSVVVARKLEFLYFRIIIITFSFYSRTRLIPIGFHAFDFLQIIRTPSSFRVVGTRWLRWVAIV